MKEVLSTIRANADISTPLRIDLQKRIGLLTAA
jgi:hypothetical protein